MAHAARDLVKSKVSIAKNLKRRNYSTVNSQFARGKGREVLNLIVEAVFLSALFLNAFLALKSGDHRLRGVAGLFLAIWFVTHYFPYTEIFVSPASFVVLSRLQIRRNGESKLAGWMVPIILAEAGIFLSHLAYPTLGYLAYWLLVQVFFTVQLIVTLIVGAKLASGRDGWHLRMKHSTDPTGSAKLSLPSH
jgi:hypothetical protein